MELPIASGGHLLVDDSYLQLLVREANSRLIANFFRIDKFLLALKAHWQWPLLRYVRTDEHASGLVRRWGHSVCSDPRGEDCFIVGGYGAELGTAVSVGGSNGGTNSYRRGLHTLSICSDDRSRPLVLNMTEDCMHAVAAVVELGSAEAAVGNRSLLIVSGGRRSPGEALSCLRLYDTRRDYSLVEIIALGEVPSHRWGHSFSLVHAGRCHCTFFLHGGRDHCTVFNDSFLVQIQWTSTSSSILCVWRRVELHIPAHVMMHELDDGLLSPRFFHAASTTPNVFPSSDDSCTDESTMPDLRGEGSWRTNDGGIEDDWVIIHGGITSLNAAAMSTTSCCLCMVNTRTGEVFDLREQEVLDDEIDSNNSSIIMSVRRFGHTLTSIGAKSFLLLGGTSTGDDSLDRDEGSPSIVIHLYIDRIGLYKAKLQRICGTSTNNNSHHSSVVAEQEHRWCQLPCQACRVHHQAVLQQGNHHQKSSEGKHHQQQRQRLLILGGGAMTLAFGPHFCCDLQLWLLSSEDSQAFDHPTDNTDLGSSSRPPALTHHAGRKQSNKQPTPMGYLLFLPTFLVRKMKVCLEAMGCLDKSRSIVKVGKGCFVSSAVIVITLDSSSSSSSSTSQSSSLLAVTDVIAGYDTLRPKKKGGEDVEVSSLLMALPISQTLYESLCSDAHRPSPSPLRNNKYISDIQQSIVGIEYLLLGQEGYAHDNAAGSDRAVAATAKPMSGVQRASQFLQALSDRHNLPLSINEDPTVAAVASAGPSSSSCQHPKQGMKFEIVGNVLMLPETYLMGLDWERVFALPHREEEEGTAGGSSLLGHEVDDSNGPTTDEAASQMMMTYGFFVFRSLAACFGLKRVARKATIDSGPKRESRVRLLYPHPQGQPDTTGPEAPGWVTVSENRIRFGFDITRVMFCSGNVTERMRMGRQRAEGEVVVDLYCGIGYYSLPLLVHARAAHVHACEWNDNSLQALRENLRVAGMLERCTIYEGDNQTTSKSLVDIADRVLLGTVVAMYTCFDRSMH